MSDYLTYRYCPNKTCENHQKKKRFKSGAEVCGECGFELKDYEFDPVTRQIIGYDEDEEENGEIITENDEGEEFIPEPVDEEAIDFDNIDVNESEVLPFNSINNEPSVEVMTQEKSIEKEEPEEPTPVASYKPQEAVSQPDADTESVLSKIEALEAQIASLKASIKVTDPTSSSNHEPTEEKNVKEVKKENTIILNTPSESPTSLKETKDASSKYNYDFTITKEEEETKREEIKDIVTKEFEEKKYKEEREAQREAFEQAYNKKKKQEHGLIQEEREKQEAILSAKEGKDNNKPNPTSKLNLNADGYYSSVIPQYEELYKKSKKRMLTEIGILVVGIIIVLYIILYITS